MAFSKSRERHRAVGGRLLANGAAKTLLRGGRNASESVAGFRRNRWLASVGINGWFASESPAGICRNTQFFGRCARESRTIAERKAMIDRSYPLALTQQARELAISRGVDVP
jgi:hypothetical protein